MGCIWQIHLDNRSVASPSLLIAVLHALSDIPSRASSFHKNCSGNPLQSTSADKKQRLHPFSLRSGMHILDTSSHLPSHSFPPMARFIATTSLTPWTVHILRLVIDWFPRCWGKLTSCLDLLSAPSHALSNKLYL